MGSLTAGFGFPWLATPNTCFSNNMSPNSQALLYTSLLSGRVQTSPSTTLTWGNQLGKKRVQIDRFRPLQVLCRLPSELLVNSAARFCARWSWCTPTGAAVRLCNDQFDGYFHHPTAKRKRCICNDISFQKKSHKKMQKRNQVKLILVFLPEISRLSKSDLPFFRVFSNPWSENDFWGTSMGSNTNFCPGLKFAKTTTAESLVTRMVFVGLFVADFGVFGSPTSGEIVQHHLSLDHVFFVPLESSSTNFGRYPREI